ncbi:MAG: DUF362 domain-containing protein, partial [Spirochaetota bacterium]
PNLLAPDPPESATVTHPAVFEAAARILLDQGTRVCYGDSPSFYPLERALRKSGIQDAADRLGLEPADFSTRQRVYFEGGHQNRVFEVARGALEADGMVSLPKLKTHGFTLMTGAVKNQFGCLPGVQKSGFHAKLEEPEKFSTMLVDLTLFLRPRLYIMDAVLAMEGNGPRRGNPVPLGLIIMCSDPVALDTVAARVAGIDPGAVPPIVQGARNGLGTMVDIQVLGERIEEVKKKFSLPRYSGNFKAIPPVIRNLLKRIIVQQPVIQYDSCTRCHECQKICPTTPKSILIRERDNYPEHDYRHCIRCYCCQETCPVGAITIRTKLF